jgi:hypothetical protein
MKIIMSQSGLNDSGLGHFFVYRRRKVRRI